MEANQTGRVLVADDSDLVLEEVARVLSARGWEVQIAQTGAEALRLAEEWKPEVAVCDLHMPGMDGFELLRRLQGTDPLLPLVVLSGESELPGVLRAVHQGIFDFVYKSGDALPLAGAVARAFVHGRVLRDNKRLTEQLKASNAELVTTVEKLARQSRELEQALCAVRETQEQLMAQEQLASIGALAAGLAHEINNPLGVMISNLEAGRRWAEDFGEAAKQGTESTAVAEVARQLIESGDSHSIFDDALAASVRIRSIVRDMMTYGRRADLRVSSVDVSQSVRRAMRTLRPQLKPGVELVEELQPASALADEPALFMVLSHLLNNAAQAVTSETGPQQIVVRSGSDEGGPFVEVRDSGRGIPEEQQRRIFDPFFTTKRPGPSTGMGLAVCRNLMTRMKGSVKVQSRAGVGSTFWLRFDHPIDPASSSLRMS
jgi:two-component system, NtrC family, sensor kinase